MLPSTSIKFSKFLGEVAKMTNANPGFTYKNTYSMLSSTFLRKQLQVSVAWSLMETIFALPSSMEVHHARPHDGGVGLLNSS